MGCNDCHTPWKIGPKGPETDMTRALTGHPQDMKMPPAPELTPGPWMGVMRRDQHRVGGPVGRELHREPDARQGNGARRLDRGDVHQDDAHRLAPGQGPASAAADAVLDGWQPDRPDIKDLFAYLQSLPPVRNRVPAPIDPNGREVKAKGKAKSKRQARSEGRLDVTPQADRRRGCSRRLSPCSAGRCGGAMWRRRVSRARRRRRRR